jgi:hypothetical protein
MRAWTVALLGVSLHSPAWAGGEAGDVPMLRHNPFVQPQIAAARTEESPEESPQEGVFELRATLHAGAQSLANVNGVILRLGEEVEGYRLAEVEERSAVLRRGETRIVVSLEDD